MLALRLSVGGAYPSALKRSGLGQDAGPDAFFEHVRGGDVDGYRQDGFGLAAKGNEVEERPAGLEVDEQVDVVCSSGIANGGAEDGEIADTQIPGGRM